ncbi:MAG TPA: hypothetical protein VFS39_07620 [Nitrospira sp.]|nr:hypothetical protein [Nitrospira sp.]
MHTLISPPIEFQDDVLVPLATRCDRTARRFSAFTSASLIARIDWCRLQTARAETESESEGWCAEGEGLTDAILQRDRRHEYAYSRPSLAERYVMGFEDGQTLLRIVWIERAWRQIV